MLTFTGVNTGKTYEVGQSYRNGDGTVSVAQPDGSFINQQTGSRTVGSSSPGYGQTVTWSYDGPSYSSGTPFAASDHQYVTELLNQRSEAMTRQALASGYSGVSSAASLPSPSTGGSAGSLMPAARVASFAQSARGTAEASWSQPGRALWDEYKDGPSAIPNSLFYQVASPSQVKGRPLPMGGFNWEMNPNWPNAEKIEEEFGDSEFLSPGFFMNWGAALGAVAWNASRLASWADSSYPEIAGAVRSTPIGVVLDAADISNGLPVSDNRPLAKSVDNALGSWAASFPVNDNYDAILSQYRRAGIAANGPL